ncbi:outer membrane protein assembly factor BamA, partial [Thioclava sp. BHET1]
MQDRQGARAAVKQASGVGRSRLLRAGTFLLMTTACGLTMSPAIAADHSFSSVKVEGLQRIEPGTVLSYAGIKRGQEVSDADLNAAYQRIQNSGLFQSVVLTPEGNQLIIKVQEYPVINVINFEGNSRLKADDLQKVIKSQSRKVYSPAQAETDAANITQVYRNQKRYGVIVTPKIIPRADNRVDLVFEINEGKPTYINRISFVGNKDFSDYRLSQVLETKQAGLLRGIFSDNSYDPNRTQKDIQKLTDFYQQRGYMDFRVEDVSPEMNRNRSGFFVTYTIHEGNRYT